MDFLMGLFLGIIVGMVLGLVLAYMLGERKRKDELASVKQPDTRRSGRAGHALDD